MKFYQKLSQISFLKKSYAFKFLFVTFLGMHIPLVGILFFVLYTTQSISPTAVLIFLVVITFFSSAITLFLLTKLIKPISIASKALNDYRESRILSELPSNYSDEVGVLMSNIQNSIYDTEIFIKEKQDLIFMLSHDLKNFAGNPQGLARLIIQEETSESVKHLAELICQSSDLQFQYIENFVKILKEQDDISKITKKPTLLSFSKVVTIATNQINQSLLQKNINLISSVEVEQEFLTIDEGFITQVLVNLLINAIKFSYADGIVKLRVYKKDNTIVFTVSDNGIGFNQSDIKEIFMKFTKMSKLGTANESSTGIGLYLCKKIIKKHGGKLFATSEGKNKGATFTIILEL